MQYKIQVMQFAHNVTMCGVRVTTAAVESLATYVIVKKKERD